MRKVGGILMAGVLAVVLVTSGCGDDDDSSGDTTASTATTISVNQTSVTVGPNTSITVARPTTTGQ